MDSSQSMLLGFMILISVIGLAILTYAIVTMRKKNKKNRKK